MTRKFTRRTVLVGGGAVALAVVAGGATATTLLGGRSRSPAAEDADFAALLAEVRDDYINGRVVEHEGWILSQHEFDTLASRQREHPTAAAAT